MLEIQTNRAGTIDLYLLKTRKSLTPERGFPLGPIDSYKLLFPFSLREGESNFLTVMLIVLLIYILYKGFQICKWSITHCTSFPQFS